MIDNALPPGHRDPGLVNWLFVIAVVVAVVITGLNLVNRWLGSAIGEGLIYDLRVSLYDHVQRMPIAFFTRTQTGSLMSRLSNDVLGAQQTVGTAASATSDLFTLVFTLFAMLTLSWKVTLLALVVIPGFVLLDRRLAHRLAALSRRRMATQRRHDHHDDRALRRVRSPAGQAVRPPGRRIADVLGPGGQGARLRRAACRREPRLLRHPRAGRRASAPPRCTGSAATP